MTPERTDSPLKRPRAVWWTLGAVAAVVVVVVIVGVVWSSNAVHPQQEAAPMPSQPTPAARDDLRDKDSAEGTLSRYEQILAQTADQTTALQPGLTWRWTRDSTTISCAGEFADTQGVQILTRHALFDGPIQDTVWPAALEAVRNQASELGADGLHVYVDEPNDHDVALTSSRGVEVRFGTKAAATLSARSDCHLSAADRPQP